ncbi:MAG: DUF2461 domain-containing protein [Candidatus Wallbacteria bacterium]|nr:DUF2461 domain-containing protein [Candidatus Wallbacteria bacterium]
MASQAHFGPQLFRFLSDLSRHNDREWFQKNKHRYEQDVRDPMLAFIGDFAPYLEKISPAFLADPRPNGGSLFRIHRDVRFSSDKSPYKTNAGAHFRHESHKDAHAPGFYLHLEPREVFAAAGVWHPDGASLTRIRQTIVADPDGWRRASTSKALRAAGALDGDSLKRPPAGFDADHPLIEDLKRKDFFAIARLTPEDVCKPGFIREFAKTCEAFSGLTRFLTVALGLRW